jgi:hypothetical protein
MQLLSPIQRKKIRNWCRWLFGYSYDWVKWLGEEELGEEDLDQWGWYIVSMDLTRFGWCSYDCMGPYDTKQEAWELV